MKLSSLFGLLALVSAQATAVAEPVSDWQQVGYNHSATIYLDFNRIRQSVVFPRVWQLIDLREPTGYGVHSRKAFVEYDCKSGRRRTLASSAHNQPMGASPPRFVRVNTGAWQTVYADTVDEAVLQLLCNRGHGKLEHQNVASEQEPQAPATHSNAHPAEQH